MFLVRFAGTEIETSPLGFGCASLLRLPSAAARERLLATAFDCGVRHFDVARSYGLGFAEAELGRFLRGRREQVVVATKFGIELNPGGIRLGAAQGLARRLVRWMPALRRLARAGGGSLYGPRRYDAATARASLETSLRALGTDHVDLFLLHEPPAGAAEGSDAGEFLERARSAGKIRAWGVSGEVAEILPLRGKRPDLVPLFQVGSDAIDRAAERSVAAGARPAATFRVLSAALPRIVRHAGADRATRRRWNEATGLDCSSPAAVAGLLLRHAARANPGGVVLFSTTRPERIAPAVEQVTRTDGAGDAALDALLRLIDAELLGGSRDAS